MSRDSLVNAKAELHALLCDDASVFEPAASLVSAGVTAVYDYEPKPGDALRNVFVTVATLGMTATQWRYTVRIYAGTDVDARAAAQKIDAVMLLVDGLIATNPGFGPSEWIGPEWDDELGAFVAANPLFCIRDDLSS